jgi:hypothetical protein
MTECLVVKKALTIDRIVPRNQGVDDALDTLHPWTQEFVQRDVTRFVIDVATYETTVHLSLEVLSLRTFFHSLATLARVFGL